jgi:hypothetical protein
VSAYVETKGQLETVLLSLTNTNDRTIIDADESIQWQLESLIASCDGTPTTFFFWISDGSTSFHIVNGDQIAANEYIQIKDHSVKLKPGWSFMCKAGTASHITVTVSLLKISRRPEQPQTA